MSPPTPWGFTVTLGGWALMLSCHIRKPDFSVACPGQRSWSYPCQCSQERTQQSGKGEQHSVGRLAALACWSAVHNWLSVVYMLPRPIPGYQHEVAEQS